MKIAFDCYGTLMNGPDKVRKLFDWFESKGCELIVWSNSYGYCIHVKETIGDRASYMTKTTKWDLETCVNPEEEYVDIAVDDDSEQTWLAARSFIWVENIPDNEEEFEATYAHFIK